MQPFRVHTGLVAPLDRVNVDTDAIIPKQFLKRIERTGFGQFLFYDWRFRDDGSPNPDFVLNQPRYQARASSSPAITSVAARRANTPPGPFWIMAFASSSPRPSPTSFTTTASRTASCPSSSTRTSSTRCFAAPSHAGLYAHRRPGAMRRP